MRPTVMQTCLLVIVALVLVAPNLGCEDGEPQASPPPAGESYVPPPSPLQSFCEAGAAACSDVTAASCRQIVIDAAKFVAAEDVPCAEESTTCADTSVCLDLLGSVPVVDAGNMPTSMWIE